MVGKHRIFEVTMYAATGDEGINRKTLHASLGLRTMEIYIYAAYVAVSRVRLKKSG